MANHKRKRPKNRRAGCLLCKPYKQNGFRTEREDGERFSDHKRRLGAELDIADFFLDYVDYYEDLAALL